MLTQKELKRNIKYNKKTGEVVFKHECNCEFCNFRKKITKNKDGYCCININGKNYKLHRIIWLYVYGKFPKYVDHINGKRDDNRIENLSDVKQEINCRNKKLSTNNTSGFSGVYFDKKRNKWVAQIEFKTNGKRNCIFLGRFLDKNEAIQKRKEANSKYCFGENHGT